MHSAWVTFWVKYEATARYTASDGDGTTVWNYDIIVWYDNLIGISRRFCGALWDGC